MLRNAPVPFVLAAPTPMDAHCPRCGALLPQTDEVLCTSCGFTRGRPTVALEVTPAELVAELEGRMQADDEGVLHGEISKVVTTPSGLLSTGLGAEAVEAAANAERSRTGLVIAAIAVLFLLAALTLLLMVVVKG